MTKKRCCVVDGRLHACPNCGAVCVCGLVACEHECDPPADELADWDHHDDERGAVPKLILGEGPTEATCVG